MAIAMKYYYPDYFDDFECVPGHECPDSCCIRWQIVVDPDTLKKYRHVQGPLGKRMAEKIDFSTGRICPHGEDNRCEFLNEDNLCDIVLELGENALCETSAPRGSISKCAGTLVSHDVSDRMQTTAGA